MNPWQRKKVTTEMLGAYQLIYSELDEETADKLMAKVSHMLTTRHMASSAIEGFNARQDHYKLNNSGSCDQITA